MAQQMGVAFPDDVRALLEAASTAAGHSLAEEIRRRVKRTLRDDAMFQDEPTMALMDRLKNTVSLTRSVTGKAWHKDPATAYLLKLVIGAHLDRHGAKECKEIKQVAPMVDSTDPRIIAAVIETTLAFEFRADQDSAANSQRLLVAIELAKKGEKG
jgi:hypothetical protein